MGEYIGEYYSGYGDAKSLDYNSCRGNLRTRTLPVPSNRDFWSLGYVECRWSV